MGVASGCLCCCSSTFSSFSSKTFSLTYQFRTLTFLSAPPLLFSSCSSSFLHLHLLFSTVSLFLFSSLYLIPPCSSPCSSVLLPILHHVLLVFYLPLIPLHHLLLLLLSLLSFFLLPLPPPLPFSPFSPAFLHLPPLCSSCRLQ